MYDLWRCSKSLRRTTALTRGTPCRQRISRQYSAITRKQCEIGCKLVLLTNRKSHTAYRLVLKLVTLNDLERRNGRYFVSVHATRYKLRSHLRQTNCSKSRTFCDKNVAQRFSFLPLYDLSAYLRRLKWRPSLSQSVFSSNTCFACTPEVSVRCRAAVISFKVKHVIPIHGRRRGARLRHVDLFLRVK